MITISTQLDRRLRAFKRVVEAVLEEELSLRTHIEIVLDRGMKLMLAELLPRDAEVLQGTIQQIAVTHPNTVYRFVADVLTSEDDDSIDRGEIRRRIGFQPPPRQDPR